MADSPAVTTIKLQLPDEAADFGIDSAAIEAFLATPLSQTKTMLACWRVIAAKAATITDVSESGSSRTMPIFDRAKLMIDFWQGRSDVEDQQSEVLPPRPHGASHTSVRV